MIHNMEREKNFLAAVENEVMMNEAEMSAFFDKYETDGYAVMADSRDMPIHNRKMFPKRWLDAGCMHSFEGVAQKGEYYAFQLVVTSKEDIDKLCVCYKGFGLKVDCINRDGVDSYGKAFTKQLNVIADKIQPLWFGVQIPMDCVESEIHGIITVTPAGKPATEIAIKLVIGDEVLEDCGDSEPWRHSRLRWLNSDVAVDDGITYPFTPLVAKNKSVKGLGHKVMMNCSGLPKAVQSFFNETNESLKLAPTDIIAGDFSFDICAGGLEKKLVKPFTFTKIADGAVCWESEWKLGDNIDVVCTARMEYDGYIEYDLAVTGVRETEVNDIALKIPYRKDAAKYWMGMGEMGGYRTKDLDWKWEQKYNQDTMWMGEVNAGMMVRLKDENYEKPMMLIYYHYYPLVMPTSWDNGGKGGCKVTEQGDVVMLEAYSGARTLKVGETLHYKFDLSITPVKPIDKIEHWQDHYFHQTPDNAKPAAACGANIINIHHANDLNPFINWPFFETEDLQNFVEHCHDESIRVKLYDTVKEITVRQVEFWALMSLNGEIIPTTYEVGKSFQGDVDYADEWFAKYLGKDFMTAWRQRIRKDKYKDEMEASVVAAPMSRYNNYFLEGVKWLLENTGMDGLYFDDVAFNREIMKRCRKVLDRDHPKCSIDLHSWNYYKNNNVDDSSLAGWGNSMNLYIDNFAFIDRLWFGEGFDYNVAPDNWLIEISGIPFGMMGEMLQFGGNVWRGMVFGMSNRMPQPEEFDPTDLWNLWNDFRMWNSTMVGFWNSKCPVCTGNDKIKATVYKQPNKLMIVAGSWSDKDETINLNIDFEALGIDKSRCKAEIPFVKSFQDSHEFSLDAPLTIPAGKGWLILIWEE